MSSGLLTFAGACRHCGASYNAHARRRVGTSLVPLCTGLATRYEPTPRVIGPRRFTLDDAERVRRRLNGESL